MVVEVQLSRILFLASSWSFHITICWDRLNLIWCGCHALLSYWPFFAYCPQKLSAAFRLSVSPPLFFCLDQRAPTARKACILPMRHCLPK